MKTFEVSGASGPHGILKHTIVYTQKLRNLKDHL